MTASDISVKVDQCNFDEYNSGVHYDVHLDHEKLQMLLTFPFHTRLFVRFTNLLERISLHFTLKVEVKINDLRDFQLHLHHANCTVKLYSPLEYHELTLYICLKLINITLVLATGTKDSQ